jgi:hypothetical protein
MAIIALIVTALVAVLFVMLSNRNNDLRPDFTQITRTTVNAYGYAPVAGEDYVAGEVVFALREPLLLTYNSQEIPEEQTSISDLDVTNPADLLSILNNEADYIKRNYRGETELYSSYTIYTNGDVLDTMTELQKLESVLFAEPQYIAKPLYEPTDDYYHSINTAKEPYNHQWNLYMINMDKAWTITRGSNDVRVGVYDTGVDHKHFELSETVKKGYYKAGSSDVWIGRVR